MIIRRMREADYPMVEAIARELGHRHGGKGWFSPEAYEHSIPLDIRVQKGFVAEVDGRAVGFITYAVREKVPYIGWMGVEPGRHRRGVGRALVTQVESTLASFGAKELAVETPTEEAGRGSDYEATYKFYTGMGFSLHRVRKLGEAGFESDCDIAVLRKVFG